MAFDLAKMPKLQGFLSHWNSGFDSNTMTQEMYDAYKGDDILAELKKFDPNAHWTYNDPSMGNAGEGGGPREGTYRLDFDPTKLPKTKHGEHFTDVRLANMGRDYINKDYVYDDDNYGTVSNYKNFKKPKDPTWTKIAPLVVGMGAPLAAGYLAAMGYGAAGLTSAVTGSGLGAGAGGSLGAAINSGVKGLPGMASGVSHGDYSGVAKGAMSFIPGMQNVTQWLPAAQMAYNMSKRR